MNMTSGSANKRLYRVFLCGFGGLTNSASDVRIDLPQIHFLDAGVPASPILGSRHLSIEFEQVAESWCRLRHNIALIYGPRIYVPPAGPITESTGRLMQSNILDALARAGTIDAVLLCMPGVLYDLRLSDVSGALVESVRHALGENAFIGILQGANGPVSMPVLSHADALVCSLDNHAQAIAATNRLLHTMHQTLQQHARPVTSMLACDAWQANGNADFAANVQALFAESHAIEGVLSASVSWAGAGSNSHAEKTSVVVVTNDNLDLSQREAARLCKSLDELCRRSGSQAVNVREAFRLMSNSGHRSSVLIDTGDNPMLGAAGESGLLLDEVLSRNIQSAIVGPICNTDAVDACVQAGVGQDAAISLVRPEMRGFSINFNVVVQAYTASLKQLSGQREIDCGHAVLVALKNRPDIHLVLLAKRIEAMSTHLFTELGIRLDSKRVIIIKSTNSITGLEQLNNMLVIPVATAGETFVAQRELDYRPDITKLMP